ncbi:MAG: hypothetical protein J7K78_05130, partial [Thaumarchaeota archaeon]|nr:hypothetical protein [Nitrososphaerota archaeon]
EEANKAGIKLMVGCNEETHIAISAAIHYTSSTSGMMNADLDSDLLLFDLNIVREDPLETFVSGARVPREKPGLGVELSNWFKALVEDRLILERIA